MVKAQAGILETDGDDEVKAKLASCVADLDVEVVEREWLEMHLRPLAGLGGEPEPGGESRTEAFAAWRRFFEAMADKRPLVLVFEDLHWADDGLLDFVDHLVEWGASVPMLVVCTARPELLERRPGWGGGKLNATTLSISALSDTDTSRLLGSLLDRPLLEAEQQQTLLARAGGNPLYAELLAHHYRSALDLMKTGRAEIPPKVIDDARAAIADAGERALSLNGFAAAARFYEEALDLAGDEPAARAELEYKLALSLFGMGDARRINALERARDSLLEAGARQRAAVAEALVAEAWWLQGRHDLCLEHLGQAEELIADAPPSPEKARVLTQVSRFQMLGDRNEESIRTAAEALDLIDRFSLDEL